MSGKLEITVIKATITNRGNSDMVFYATIIQDPYVIVQLGEKFEKTQVVKNSFNPTWNEKFVFQRLKEEILRVQVKYGIIFKIMEKDTLGDDIIGE